MENSERENVDALLAEKKAVYITTFEITLELWEKILSTQRLPVTGAQVRDVLGKQFWGEYYRYERDFRLELWERFNVDCTFFPSAITAYLRINNVADHREWGVSFYLKDLVELRRQNVLHCGIDMSFWIYRDDAGHHCVAWSEFWGKDRIKLLVYQLAPSPVPNQGSSAGEDTDISFCKLE